MKLLDAGRLLGEGGDLNLNLKLGGLVLGARAGLAFLIERTLESLAIFLPPRSRAAFTCFALSPARLISSDRRVQTRMDDEEAQQDLRLCAADAFRLFRALPRPTDPVEAAAFLLRAGALAVLGDKGADAARWLSEAPWPELAPDAADCWPMSSIGRSRTR